MWQPRVGMAWDRLGDGKSVVRANFGIFSARQNMLTQVGSVTTNGLQQQTIFLADRSAPSVRRADARLAWRRDAGAGSPAAGSRTFPACACSTATTRTRASTRSTSRTSRSSCHRGPVTRTSSSTKGTNLSRFLNYNRSGPVCCDVSTTSGGTGNVYTYTGRAAVGSATRRGHGRDEPRPLALQGTDTRRPQAPLATLSARGQLRPGEGRRR